MDFLSQILPMLAPLLQAGGGIYNMVSQPGQPQQMPQMPPQQGGGFQMPDMSGMMGGFNDMFLQMQQAMADQQNQFQAQQQMQQQQQLQKNLVGMRSGLQEKGIYSGGALTPESLSGLMGDPNATPDAIYKALQTMGLQDTWNPGTGLGKPPTGG